MIYTIATFVCLMFYEITLTGMDQAVITAQSARTLNKIAQPSPHGLIPALGNDVQTIIAQYLSWGKTEEASLPDYLQKFLAKLDQSPQTMLSPDGKYITLQHTHAHRDTQRIIYAWDIPNLNHFYIPTKYDLKHIMPLRDNKIAFLTDHYPGEIFVYDFTSNTFNCLINHKQLNAMGIEKPVIFSISNSGTYLAINNIILINTQDGYKIYKNKIEEDPDSIAKLQFSSDDKYLVVSCPNNAKIYTMGPGPLEKYLEFEPRYINAREVAFSCDNSYFAYQFDENTIDVIDLKTKLIIKKITNPDNNLRLLKFLNTKPTVLLLAKQAKDQVNCELQTWDIKSNLLSSEQLNTNLNNCKSSSIITSENDSYIIQRSLVMPPDSFAIYRTDYTNHISLFRNDKSILLQPIPAESKIISETSQAFQAPMIDLEVARIFNKIPVRDIIYNYLESFEDIAIIPRTVFDLNLKISPTGEYIATYDNQSNVIKLWNITQKQFCKTLIYQSQKFVYDTIFSANEKYLLINYGTTIILYDIDKDTSTIVCESKDNKNFEKVKFSSNDKSILALQGKLIYLYNIAKAQYICILFNNGLDNEQYAHLSDKQFNQLKIDNFNTGEIHDIACNDRSESLRLCMSLKTNGQSKNNIIIHLDLNTLRINGKVYIDQNVTQGSFSKSGTYFCGTMNYTIDNSNFGLGKIWQASDAIQIHTLPYQNITPELSLNSGATFLNIRTPTKLINYHTDSETTFILANATGEENQKIMQFSDLMTHAIYPHIDNAKNVSIRMQQNLGLILNVLHKKYQNMIIDFKNAVKENDLDSVAKILKLGIKSCDYDTENETPVLFEVIENNNFELLKLLLAAKEDVNKIYKKISPLMLAVSLNNELMVSALLQHGSNINYQSTDDSSYWACIKKSYILFEHGDTALIYAARLQLPNMVKLLLEHGANRSIKNAANKTVHDLALESNNQESIKLLQEASCSIA
jgi:uncharacterized protein